MSIVVRTLSEQTYQVLRRRILSGGLGPGLPIRQDAIAIELGVSRIPLREALTRLEQDGLLKSYPNRGYVVRPMSLAEAEEIFALRLKLEPDAAAMGCQHAKVQDDEAAKTSLRRLEEVLEQEGSDHVAYNREFHLTLARPGAGAITLQLLTQISMLAERYVCAHLSHEGRSEQARQEHHGLIDAWLRRDTDIVRSLSAAHIQHTLDDLRAELTA